MAIKADRPRRPSSFSFQPAPAPPVALDQPPLPLSTQWVTDRDRDALRAFFAAHTTHLFLHPTPLPPTTLTSLLSSTGSVYTCIEALSSLQRKGQRYGDAGQLLQALQVEMALLYPRPSDPSERPPSPHASNRAARDALFAYLSSPYCHLFSHSVKLNNLTLDHLLFQGRGLAPTLAACHAIDERGAQFDTAAALTSTVATAASHREQQEADLLALLRHPQHQKALFALPTSISDADVAKLWLGVQAAEETLSYVLLIEEDVLMRSLPRLRSVDDLRHEVQRRHAATRVERRKEMERVYEFLH